MTYMNDMASAIRQLIISADATVLADAVFEHEAYSHANLTHVVFDLVANPEYPLLAGTGYADHLLRIEVYANRNSGLASCRELAETIYNHLHKAVLADASSYVKICLIGQSKPFTRLQRDAYVASMDFAVLGTSN